MLSNTLEQVKHLCKLQGYVIGDKLGEGMKGFAFELSNIPDQVIKITTDYTEAYASNNILKKDLKNVVKIYRVFQFKPDYVKRNLSDAISKLSVGKQEDVIYQIDNYSFIVQEELFSAQAETRKPFLFFDEFGIYTKLRSENYENSPALLAEIKQWVNEILSGKRNAYGGEEKRPDAISNKTNKIKEYVDKYNDESYKAISFYYICCYEEDKRKDTLDDFCNLLYRYPDFHKFSIDIANGLIELIDNKVQFLDVHPGNVMKDKHGNFKIIDLGVSKSPYSNIEVVEQVKHKLGKSLIEHIG